MAYLQTNDWLNLRSTAEKKKDNSNVLAIMAPNTVVEQLSTDAGEWVKIRYKKGKDVFEGFASKKYLRIAEALVEKENELPKLPEAHLISKRLIGRTDPTGRVFALNDRNPARADFWASSADKRKQIVHDTVAFLDVERHGRYLPTGGQTFCNIYAYDLAYCCGLYLPRVWWRMDAQSRIMQGEDVKAIYEQTVREQNANQLTDWFEVYGNLFGWRRVQLLNDLQQRVNAGTLGIIVGQRTDLNRSGHIVGVVPETEQHRALRSTAGIVTSPLQSQAGVANKRYFTGNNWWLNGKFRKFGYWVWEG